MSKDVFLGINLLHDTSAAIICDNKVVAAVEQERFDGISHSTSFPKDAIAFCLDAGGVKPKDIKGIATTYDYSGFILNDKPFEQNSVAHDDCTPEGKRKQLYRIGT